jgi:hypothetical protein
MKSITRIARRLMLVFLALIASSTMFFSFPAVAASVDVTAIQYLADATTQTQTTSEIIDKEIGDYRSLKGKLSKNQKLTIDEIKTVLFVINTRINALVEDKKDLLALNPPAPTEDIDNSISDYRSLKGKVSKNEGNLTLDEIKKGLRLLNTTINVLLELKKA